MKLKQTIASVLSVVWLLLFILLISEPTQYTVTNTPEYVGWIYVVLIIGLPILIIKLLPKAKH